MYYFSKNNVIVISKYKIILITLPGVIYIKKSQTFLLLVLGISVVKIKLFLTLLILRYDFTIPNIF